MILLKALTAKDLTENDEAKMRGLSSRQQKLARFLMDLQVGDAKLIRGGSTVVQGERSGEGKLILGSEDESASGTVAQVAEIVNACTQNKVITGCFYAA